MENRGSCCIDSTAKSIAQMVTVDLQNRTLPLFQTTPYHDFQRVFLVTSLAFSGYLESK